MTSEIFPPPQVCCESPPATDSTVNHGLKSLGQTVNVSHVVAFMLLLFQSTERHCGSQHTVLAACSVKT